MNFPKILLLILTLLLSQTTWSQGTISGKITNSDGIPLQNFMVKVSGGIELETFSDAAGNYTMSLPFGGNYQIAPYNNEHHSNGVDTQDLKLIQQHLGFLQDLPSPYSIIAADVSGNGVISSNDITQISTLILGVIPKFLATTSWRFVVKNYIFPNPSNPFQEEWLELAVINDFTANISGLDFIGIKMGDVNNSAISGTTAINSMPLKRAIECNVFPNPFSDAIYFDFYEHEIINGTFQLIDIQGNTVISKQFTGNLFELQKDKLVDGVYFYKIMEKGAIIASGKVFQSK